MNNIKKLLSAIEKATGIKPTAFKSTEISKVPAISYTAYRQSDNAVVESWRFQTRVTAQKLEDAIEIEEKIANKLTTLGDEWKLDALNITINGGGTLEDERTGFPQLLTYYDINVRS